MIPKKAWKTKARRAQPERALHSVVADWLDLELDPLQALWFPVPNAANFDMIRGRMMKETKQIKAGVHDICVMWRLAARQTGVAFIELKIKPNKPTEEQEAFGDAVIRTGGTWRACYSLDDVREFLSMLSVPMLGRVK